MSEQWFSVERFNIRKLHDLMKSGQIVIKEEYQRGLVWKLKQKAELIDSILEGFPIGTFVIVKGNDIELLDGQQRVYAISDFIADDIVSSKNQKYSDLSSSEKEAFDNYAFPAISLDPGLSKDKRSLIFVRLQEGTPLSTAEKVYAFTGFFRNAFVDAFFNESNRNFFTYLSDKRYRARLIAAHLLTIELESNYESNKFPYVDYKSLQEINAKYKKTDLPKSVLQRYGSNLNFIGKYVNENIKQIKIREIIPLYLLVSYMRWNETLDDAVGDSLTEFILDFSEDLGKFSIYDDAPPENMDERVFHSLMRYKAYSRQALTSESLSERLDIMKKEFKRRMKKSA